MKPGNLVSIERSSIFCSRGTLAVLLECYAQAYTSEDVDNNPEDIWIVQIVGSGRQRRFLARDLKKIS